jgi:2'-5' RNA ligase
MAKKLRLFIAINFSEEEKKFLQKLTEPYQGLPIRWSEFDNIHSTMLFLGYCPEESLIEIIETCQNILKNQKPFELKLEQMILGPQPKRPRLIWLKGKAQINQEFVSLHEALKTNLEQIPGLHSSHIKTETKLPSPHITLGRIKPKEWQILPSKPEINKKIIFQSKVNSIELMSSQLMRTGPQYTILQSWHL